MPTAAPPLSSLDAFAVQIRAWARDLHGLLREVDPSRWRDARAAEARAWLERLAERGRALTREAEGRPDRLRQQVAELVALLESHVPATQASRAQVRASWAALRARAVPAYEALAAALRERALPVPSLRPTNLARSGFHAVSGLLALVLLELVLSPTGAILAASAFAATAWCLELGRRRWPGLNDWLLSLFRLVAHPHERAQINSGTWFATATAALAWLASEPVAVVAVSVLAVGDPTAAFVGRRWGRTQLRQGRSLEGSLAFVLAGALVAAGALALFHPELSLLSVVLFALAGALAGALAELFLSWPDDNLTIPLAAALAVAGVNLALTLL